jgi:hypothetical protein
VERVQWYQRLHTTAQRNYESLLQRRSISTLSVKEVWQDLEQACAKREQYIADWADQWAALTRLPQLFIAV